MRVALISDVHSNIQALDTVLEKIRNDGIDEIHCLGDLVGYAANPNEVIDRLRKESIPCLQGNHDWAATVGHTQDFNPFAKAGVAYSKQLLTEANMAFLGNLSPSTGVNLGGKAFLLVHASPWDPLFEYVLPSDAEFRRSDFSALSQDVVSMGHTHVPFTMPLGKGRLVLNVGSVGQPRDQDPRAAYAVVDAATTKAEIVRVPYDVNAAIDAILAAGLPEFTGLRLLRGL